MFADIARQLSDSNRSRKELESMNKDSFKVTPPEGDIQIVQVSDLHYLMVPITVSQAQST
ncbi:hypothetical protein E2C01_002979 [Portunus trituberculatus]|uniref:Uncharacterized protein n=1 Tax=Portunus trituberculatus TaxID=210409 RepID=A0A5B7CM71_PORTR|nr:hypothetical protein [Portunus trituberculatus]